VGKNVRFRKLIFPDFGKFAKKSSDTIFFVLLKNVMSLLTFTRKMFNLLNFTFLLSGSIYEIIDIRIQTKAAHKLEIKVGEILGRVVYEDV